jgi:hypothetical protein
MKQPKKRAKLGLIQSGNIFTKFWQNGLSVYCLWQAFLQPSQLCVDKAGVY